MTCFIHQTSHCITMIQVTVFESTSTREQPTPRTAQRTHQALSLKAGFINVAEARGDHSTAEEKPHSNARNKTYLAPPPRRSHPTSSRGSQVLVRGPTTQVTRPSPVYPPQCCCSLTEAGTPDPSGRAAVSDTTTRNEAVTTHDRRKPEARLNGHALPSSLVEDGLGVHLLLSVERAAVEDEKIVLRSGGFLAVDPEPFYRRLASAWLDLRGSGTKESNTSGNKSASKHIDGHCHRHNG